MIWNHASVEKHEYTTRGIPHRVITSLSTEAIRLEKQANSRILASKLINDLTGSVCGSSVGDHHFIKVCRLLHYGLQKEANIFLLITDWDYDGNAIFHQ